MCATVQPESGRTNYWFDNVGNITSTEFKGTAENTHYSHDALNRLTGISYADGTSSVTYTYDNGSAGSNSNNTVLGQVRLRLRR